MPPSGWYSMQRGWMDNPVFAREPYTQREAFEWCISNAAYRDHQIFFNGELVDVGRGQFITSLRLMEKAFSWTVKRVRTFLDRLESGKMLVTEKTHRWARITICNYDKYQQQGHSDGNEDGTAEAQSGHTIEQGKQGKQENKDSGEARYAFFGKVIKLNANDLERWRKGFHAIPDVEAELMGLDAWLSGQPEAKQKAWFNSVPGMLAKKQNEILLARIPPEPERQSIGPERHQGPC